MDFSEKKSPGPKHPFFRTRILLFIAMVPLTALINEDPIWTPHPQPQKSLLMGSQHPSPDVKTICSFELQIWPEIITSGDIESACLKGSRTSSWSCDVIIFGGFGATFGRKDHITWWMTSCWTKDFPSATRSRMEILTEENLVGARIAPTAVSRTFTPLERETRFPYHSFRNHDIFNSKTIKLCNCNGSELLKTPEGDYLDCAQKTRKL